MTENSRNLFFQDSLNKIAIRRASEAIAQTGAALPCRVTAVNGSIVTVAFEVESTPYTLPPVTIPKAESQWIRTPTQIGDLGMTVPSDVYLGGVSGLGGGKANISRRGTLTALVWVPVASTGFPGVDINAALVCGPNGAVIRDEGSTAIIKIVPNEITLTVGASNIQIINGQVTINSALIALNGNVVQTAGSGAGTVSMIGPLTVTHEVTANTVQVSAHIHSGVQSGSGDSGPPVPGT